MEVIDVYGTDGWKALLEELSPQLHMPIALLDKEGNVLLIGGDRNPLCTRIRENENGLKFICGQTASIMTAELKQAMTPLVDLCEAGFIRFTVPVIHDGELIGQVSGCGLVNDPDEIDAFMISKQLDISEDEVMQQIQGLEKVSEEDIRKGAEKLFDKLNVQ